MNGHFDSPLGSPGAADCGSCVGQYNVYFARTNVILSKQPIIGHDVYLEYFLFSIYA